MLVSRKITTRPPPSRLRSPAGLRRFILELLDGPVPSLTRPVTRGGPRRSPRPFVGCKGRLAVLLESGRAGRASLLAQAKATPGAPPPRRDPVAGGPGASAATIRPRG